MKKGFWTPVGVFLSCFFSATVLSANEPAPGQQPTTEATVDKIMDQAVRNISRRYNLNEAQTLETDKLMKREVRRFLKDHEKEVWPLIRDLLAAQMMGKPPENREDAMRIGKAARPLSKLAQEAIIQGNMEWRQILTAEQLQMHDYDMQEMQRTFQQIDKNFGDWEAGNPAAGPIIPVGDTAGSPSRPKQPPSGLPGPVVKLIDPNLFDTIFEKFLKDYELDQGQVDRARSILAETKEKASDFQNTNKTKFEELVARHGAAIAKRNQEELAAVETERKTLLEPFHELVTQMENRLKGLLSTAQIEQYTLRQQTAQAQGVGAGKQAGGKKKPVTPPGPASGAPSNEKKDGTADPKPSEQAPPAQPAPQSEPKPADAPKSDKP